VTTGGAIILYPSNFKANMFPFLKSRSGTSGK
jgi:hypothetical protein